MKTLFSKPIKMRKIEMRPKNLLVFFLAIASVLFLVATISAATTELALVESVRVNGVYDYGNEDISVIAGETISVRVVFESLEDASNVRMKAELEGTKQDIEDVTAYFDVEEGIRYVKTLAITVPYELKDEVSDDLALEIKIWNGDFKTEYPEITLRVQRPAYQTDIMSMSTSQSVEAGETLPIDVVVKNIGYNYLDDLYVTAKISALGIERTSYFGDLVALECTDEDGEYSCDEDDEDTVSGRFYLEIPYDVKSGIYTIEVIVQNEDLTESETRQLVITNDFPSNVIVTSSTKKVAVGEEAEYELLLINPTNKLKVYRVVTESSGSLSSSTDAAVIAVPAGSSKVIKVIASSNSRGEYDFNVNIFSGEELVSTVTLTADVEGTSLTSSVVVLTIILAIIFIVLLIVLIVLLGKKPEKEREEEFGESYY
ncbi:MAG: hypothetical protein KKF68_01135 [Nanoarchaeota archaeon]|nr:hypothetical protein [Nanoarchaeota archaeon]